MLSEGGDAGIRRRLLNGILIKTLITKKRQRKNLKKFQKRTKYYQIVSVYKKMSNNFIMETTQLIRGKFMMCMVRKACHKEEEMAVVPALAALPSCQPMTCSNSSLERILTFMDQQDLTIHSFVRLTKYIQYINNVINTSANAPRMSHGKGRSGQGLFASFGTDFDDMGFGSFGSGGSAFSSFRYCMTNILVYILYFCLIMQHWFWWYG